MVIDQEDGSCLLTQHVARRSFIKRCQNRQQAARIQYQLAEMHDALKDKHRAEVAEAFRQAVDWTFEQEDV